MPDVSRRGFMQAASVAAMAVGTTTAASARPAAISAAGKVKVVSSANGLETTKKAYEMIVAGSDPIDAVVAGVAIVEDDPRDTSVGYGGLPNERGIVELDAAVMHGPTHHAGAVASLQNVRHPAQVALQVLRRSDHVLLVGAGALDFARAHGFPEENLLTEHSRKIWLRWKETMSEKRRLVAGCERARRSRRRVFPQELGAGGWWREIEIPTTDGNDSLFRNQLKW